MLNDAWSAASGVDPWSREPDEIVRVGELEVRPDALVAVAGGKTLKLSVREFGLLVAFARRRGRVVPRSELHLAVWGSALPADARYVDAYVRKLRVKLHAALPEWEFIHTHIGFGYRFEAERSPDFHKAVTG